MNFVERVKKLFNREESTMSSTVESVTVPGNVMPESEFIAEMNNTRINCLRAAISDCLSASVRIPPLVMSELARREDLQAKNDAMGLGVVKAAKTSDPVMSASPGVAAMTQAQGVVSGDQPNNLQNPVAANNINAAMTQ